MRVSAAGALACALAMAAAAAVVSAQDNAQDVMTKVRQALGGEQQLAAVKALSLRATYQREMAMPGMSGGGRATIAINDGPPGGASPQVTGEIEIDVELPAKYIKVDTSTGVMALTRTEGFEGERPFAHAASANPGVRIQIARPGDAAAGSKMALHRNHAELARLLLGVLGSTQSSFPVSYSYGGIAESADGKADVIDVKGPEDFAARLFVDVQTHLPLMLVYNAPEPRVVMRTSERRAPGATREPRAAPEPPSRDLPADSDPPKLVEHRIFFSEYRSVGGLLFPHRITRGTAEKTTEEWEVTSYKINPVLEAGRFKVS